jgi:hypothetical protein
MSLRTTNPASENHGLFTGGFACLAIGVHGFAFDIHSDSSGAVDPSEKFSKPAPGAVVPTVLDQAFASALPVTPCTLDLVGSTPDKSIRPAFEVPIKRRDSDCFQVNL